MTERPRRRPLGSMSIEHAGQARRGVKLSTWPTWAMLSLGLGGIVVALVAWNQPLSRVRFTIAVIGFIAVLLVSTALLFIQRVLKVNASRRSGDLGHLQFTTTDKWFTVLLILSAVANGLVIAIQAARQ